MTRYSMHRALTRRDLGVSVIIIAAWGILGFGVYVYPQSRILLWSFWISLVIPMVPRIALIAIGIWGVCHRLARRVNSD